MKRVLTFALAVLIIATLASCVNSPAASPSGSASPAASPSDSASPAASPSGDRLSVVATIFPPYDFARAIAGSNADVTMLLPPASESHSFEPTPADIVKISNCDIFIYVGGESDSWVDTVLESMDGSNMRVVTLMDCVEVVEEELVEGMQEEEEESAESGEPEEPEYDEHVWTSPRNAKLIVAKITDALCEVAPQFAETFRANESEYSAKLDELDAGFREVVDGAARKTLVFGDRFPFRYFTDAYGLDYFAAFPGCSTETEPSAKTIAFLIDKVKAEQIPVVLHIELGAVRIAESIAEQTGAKVLELHSAHNISRDDFQAGRTYLDVMRTNIDRLKEALS